MNQLKEVVPGLAVLVPRVLAVGAQAAAPVPKADIIFILADVLGWEAG